MDGQADKGGVSRSELNRNICQNLAFDGNEIANEDVKSDYPKNGSKLE